MLKLLSKFSLSVRNLIYLSCILVIILLLVKGASYFFHQTIDNSWETLSTEKNLQVKDDCIKLFNTYQNETKDFTAVVTGNKKFLSALAGSNVRKGYEAVLDIEKIKNYSAEIYNSRLELFLFEGRQINPEVTDLKRALNGEKFSEVKEIGFYYYLLVYSPVFSDSSRNYFGQRVPDGVAVVGKLIDIKFEIKNKFFQNFGISKEINDKYGVNVKFDFSKPNLSVLNTDTASQKEEVSYPIEDINKKEIGRIWIPLLERSSYQLKVQEKFTNLTNVILFALNIILIILIYLLLKPKFPGYQCKLFLIFMLILSRYFWLAIDFPSGLLLNAGLEFFSPVYFASNFGFGIARSIGNLLVTSVTGLLICYLIASITIEFYKQENKHNSNLISIIVISVSVILFFLVVQLYGTIIQSLVFESNIKFFDRSSIISTSELELIAMQLAIMLISISFLLILMSLFMIIMKYSQRYIWGDRLIRKNQVWFVGLCLVVLILLVELLPVSVFEPSLVLNLRLLIVGLTAYLVFYIQRKMFIARTYRFVTLLNFSIIILIATIFTPVILLNKITSQENKYLEQESKNISKQVNDKVSFVMMTTIEDLSENTEIQLDIKDKNKISRLAFDLWSSSKLYSEELNSAVFVLDSNRKLISDFNINPVELNSDSVVNFSVRNLKKVIFSGSSIKDTLDEAEEEDVDVLSDQILQNKDQKFYSVIVPIEQSLLESSKPKPLGYVILAAQYDAKNYLAQSGIQLFRNSKRDNIINKLTSTPIYSEFSEDELVGSSNKDVSKSLIKSLEAFRTSVQDKIDKSALRFDEFEGQIYKSYYVYNEAAINSQEKIFIVSLKQNDFALLAFFVFKFILFVVVMYIIFLLFYFVYKFVEFRQTPDSSRVFRFGFREKIFMSFIIVSVIPIIILAVYTREFVKNKNTDFYNSQMISDLRIVEQYIKNRITQVDISKTTKPAEQQTTISNFFGKGFAESYKNFNLFIKNKLAATTNEELYKSGLLDFRVSANAYYSIAMLKRDFYVESEDIGSYTFIVGYKPIYDNANNLLGIISTQTVFRQYEINQELTESLVYIFGTYFITVIFLIVIVNYLSYRLSSPIIKLQQATEQLSRGNIDVEVRSSTKDELGELINSFNKMTREIKRSRQELKKVERESAWRDIARQVAHEIKNPLTPMKLAMQHLYYAYTNSHKDFKSVIQTTNRLIIDQIESLNRIATEFSDFAKMPSRNYEPLDIEQIIHDTAKLMNTDGKIKLALDTTKGNTEITGDKDEVKRALINIIRNGLQAIETKEGGSGNDFVKISSYRMNGYYNLKVQDTGVGMDYDALQKLFEPYFSTKSSGMGLGLVITKKILDDMQAKIFVESRENEGTVVEIRFKLNLK